jgi:hypothetical protein
MVQSVSEGLKRIYEPIDSQHFQRRVLIQAVVNRVVAVILARRQLVSSFCFIQSVLLVRS